MPGVRRKDKMEANGKSQSLTPQNTVFALDIGTRSIIGMVGFVENGKVNIIAVEKAEHTKRAMVDGQIEDIDQVASVAGAVKRRLEEKVGIGFDRVCVAAAGRALKTERAVFEMELDGVQVINDEIISRLEAGAICAAEETFEANAGQDTEPRRFYLVGYNVCQYYIDNYMMSSLKDHRGKKLKVDIIATFLPGEVVDSLYTAMAKTGLEIASMTLEPIAAINAAIPENLRLLNLALVDIGAGTSDIAVCRDGSVIGYTMATVAGDEITESIMKKYLVDFDTAEKIKFQLNSKDEIRFTDILGFEQNIPKSDITECVNADVERLCREISERIIEVNGGEPSALFLAGGGSKLDGLKEIITESLKMDPKRVATAGNNFRMSAVSEIYDLNDPEYTTPLGIAVSAGLNLTNDGFRVTLNDKSAKLFRSGAFTVLNLLMMNGYNYQDIMGRSGQNVVVTVNGERRVFYGEKAEPARLEVNGGEGRLSDIVRAGDNIIFVPAVNGENAKAYLTDIEGIISGMDIVVNGEIVPADTQLENGDNVVFEPLSREYTDMIKAFGQKKENGKGFEKQENFKEETAEEYGFSQEVGNKRETYAQYAADEANEAEKVADREETSIAAKLAGNISFTVNDMSLTLPEKKNKEPYYLMDMLQYSGLDLDNISGPVTLKVNGEECSFRHTLKNGDHVLIYERKKQSETKG